MLVVPKVSSPADLDKLGAKLEETRQPGADREEQMREPLFYMLRCFADMH